MSETPGQLLPMREVMARTSLSRGAVHHLVQSGRLRVVRIGRRVLVRERDLVEFVDGLDVVDPDRHDVTPLAHHLGEDTKDGSIFPRETADPDRLRDHRGVCAQRDPPPSAQALGKLADEVAAGSHTVSEEDDNDN